jgi:hypothetical protein
LTFFVEKLANRCWNSGEYKAHRLKYLTNTPFSLERGMLVAMDIAEVTRAAQRCADELAKLVDESELWIRSNSALDPVIGAYLSRGFETLKSIIMLV